MTAIHATPLMSVTQLQSLDIESALMAVQGQRANLLEQQLQGQLEDVQQRNAQIGKLNEALAAARELTAKFSDKDGSSEKPSDLVNKERKEYHKTAEWKAEFKSIKENFSPEDKAIYNTPDFHLLMNDKEGFARKQELHKQLIAPDNRTATGKQLEKLATAAAAANITVDTTDKGKLEKAIENLKSMIDTQSNSQQMDMLRLQSLSNKRNEAFEVMTNFVKKMQDSRSSIASNLR